ncbi:MAG: hypothetical protein ABIH65_04110 [Nanoarchaeota archaeon]
MKDLTMKEIFEKAKKKKISHNINEKTLEIIDEMAKITGMNRTQILDGIIMSGIKAQTNYNIKTWELLKKDKEFKDKKERIKELLGKIREFKKKWTIDNIPS